MKSKILRVFYASYARNARMHYVYGLKCKGGHYIGNTRNLIKRFAAHQNGHVATTSGREPFELVFYFATKHSQTAYDLERYFKSGSGRAFIKKHLSHP